MLDKNAMPLTIFLLFVVGALYGAVRPMEHFLLHEDKKGYHHEEKSIKVALDAKFRGIFQDVDEISFDAAVKKALSIYCHVSKDWAHILDVIRQDPLIDVDYAGKRFVKQKTPVQKNPTERIENAIYRINAVNTKVTKRKLLLMLYSAGYRDYTCRSILAKRLALIGAGFCPVGMRRSQGFVNHLQEYWRRIHRGSAQERRDCYCSVGSDDVDVVFQMVYMQKHKIIDALAQAIERDQGEVYDEALARQNALLTYLQERADQPCKSPHIIEGLQQYDFPRGVAYEVANLVFLGKAVVTYNMKELTYTLVSDGTFPCANEEECDELVLFKNKCKYTDEGCAILQTYLQGYRKYPPAKMALFQRAFALMHFGEPISGEGQKGLEEFLATHQHVPPIWQWDADMEKQGQPLLMRFYHRYLDAVFEMHSRGTLHAVQSFAQPRDGGIFQKEELFENVKEFFRNPEKINLWGFAGFLQEIYTDVRKERNKWVVVLRSVTDFIQNVHYDIEKDVFTWVEEPTPPADMTRTAVVREMCVLRNRYPTVGALCMEFMIRSQGFFIKTEDLHAQFSALDVLGLVPSKNNTEFMQNCRGCFACLTQSSGAYTEQKMNEAFAKTSRVRRVVLEALKLREDSQLQKLAEETRAVPRKRPCQAKTSPEKRTKLDDSVVVNKEEDTHESFDQRQNPECAENPIAAIVLAAQLASMFGHEEAKKWWQECKCMGNEP